MSFPNQRGHARRSAERNVRYETHKPVLAACIEQLPGAFFAIEHGMGLGSTPFFHQQPEVTIVSFEREKEWARCADCTGVPHSIVIIDDDNVTEQVKHGFYPERTLALVDGFASQRVHVLTQWMSQSVVFNDEHDAETMTSGEVQTRRDLAQRFNYTAFQYVSLNPESVVYVHSSRSFKLEGCVAL